MTMPQHVAHYVALCRDMDLRARYGVAVEGCHSGHVYPLPFFRFHRKAAAVQKLRLLRERDSAETADATFVLYDWKTGSVERSLAFV